MFQSCIVPTSRKTLCYKKLHFAGFLNLCLYFKSYKNRQNELVTMNLLDKL